jgi:hypothetical protein
MFDPRGPADRVHPLSVRRGAVPAVEGEPGNLEYLIDRHFRVLEASAPVPGFGRYLRPVMLGSAHLVLAAAVREAYDQGRLDAALAIRERERP